MKTIVTLGIVMSVLGAIAFFFPNVTEVTNIREYVEEEAVEVTPLDIIDKANEELARINAELDGEETRLLEDIKAIEAEAQAKVVEKKARLEKIRETRSSFQ